MFNENIIDCLLEQPQIHEAVTENKKDFISREAALLDINDHDFLSLILITPAIGMAKANGSVGLFEEFALNKAARKMSKGGHFFRKDPVAYVMKYLIKDYDKWEMRFLNIIKMCMSSLFSMEDLNKEPSEIKSSHPLRVFIKHVMIVPYGFIRFLTAIFMRTEDNLIMEREISKVEYNKFLDIIKKLELAEYPVMQSFLKTFNVK